MTEEISLEDRLDSYFVGRKVTDPDGVTRRLPQVHVDMDVVATDVVRLFKTLDVDVKTLALKEKGEYFTLGITKSDPKANAIVSLTADFEGENFTKFVLYRSFGRDVDSYMWDEHNVSKSIGGVLTRKYVQHIMLDIFERI